ncbi:hypothetical protein FB451DRAFT_1130589 [Mycena latifolia]|nr:hypothetical protein FB451DRAFT_1130589 [Mycena latifolia]
MSTSGESPALLVVCSDPGSDIAPEEFNAWFAQEPFATEGARAGIRYKAIDERQPAWLVLYEAASASPDGLVSAVHPEPPQGLRTLSRSAYEHSSTRTHPATAPADLPAPFLYLARASVTPAAEAAFDAWYGGPHTDLFMRVPGWRRVRRYTLHAHAELGAQSEPAGRGAPHKHLALHELSNAEFADTPEYAALFSTEEAKEMRKALLGIEVRVFELYRPG